MDLTVYLFDSTKAVRAVITRGIVQLIHKERARTLNAEIPVKYAAKPGEYLGFACVDGRFRLFAIDYADDDDNTATTIITATDAAKDELTGTVIMVTEQESAGIGTATKEMLTAAGWTLGLDETDGRTTAVEGGLRSAWDVLAAFETDGNLFINPYYEFDGKAITGRVVDLSGKKPVYTGRLVQRGTDAENIVVTRKNRPRPMIYPQGEDGLTIANAVWSREKGDPVDKPAGQLWIGVPEAVAKYPGQGQAYDVETDDPEELMTKGWEKAQESAEASLTATATISDMEMIRGQSWKSIRLFYIVRVRPRFGQDAEAQVIEIARNYVRNDETKITLGEEPDSSANQIRKLAKTTAANVKELGKYKAQWKDMLVTVEELEEYTRTTVTEAWLDLKASTESSFAQLGARLDSTDAKNDEQFRTLSQSVLTLESDLDSATAQLAASIAKIEDGELKRLSEAVLDLDANLDSATASLTARVDDNEAALRLTATDIGTLFEVKADVTHVQRLVADEVEVELAEFMDALIAELNVANLTTMTLEAGTVETSLFTAQSIANFNGGLYANSGIQVTGNANVSGSMKAAGVDTNILRFKDTPMGLNNATVVSSKYLPYHMMVSGVMLANGKTIDIYCFTQRPVIETRSIQYIGPNTSED